MTKQNPIYRAAASAYLRDPAGPVSISLTDTAKCIRATLKAKFAGIKFSVKSDRYSGGSSIRVTWIDGPAQSAVQDVISPYASQGFDGMIDMAYCKGGWLYPDGSAGYRSSQGGERSGGHAPAYDMPAADREAVPVTFGPSYVTAERRQSLGELREVMASYAGDHDDDLSRAIEAGTVTAAGDDGYAYIRGADGIMVGAHDPVWADVAIHRYRQSLFARQAA